MSFDENQAVVRGYVDAFNRGDLDAVCGYFAPDAVIYGVLGSGDIKFARPIWEQLKSSFGMNLQIEAMVAEGESVVVRFRERGTFVKAYRDVEPTGKSYEITAMEWFEVRGGKITQRWGVRDAAAIARHVGVPLMK